MTTHSAMTMRSLQRKVLRDATVVEAHEVPINLAVNPDGEAILLLGPITLALPVATDDAKALADGLRAVADELENASDASQPAASGPRALT